MDAGQDPPPHLAGLVPARETHASEEDPATEGEGTASLARHRGGTDELQGLAARYHAAGGRERSEGASLITYILVHEREHGLIAS